MNGPQPDAPPAGAATLALALAAVASRALATRSARNRDWGPHSARVEEWCWRELGAALDDLELAAPAMYATVAARQSRLLDELHRDLGLDP